MNRGERIALAVVSFIVVLLVGGGLLIVDDLDWSTTYATPHEVIVTKRIQVESQHTDPSCKKAIEFADRLLWNDPPTDSYEWNALLERYYDSRIECLKG